MTTATNTVFAWIADNFKLLAAAATAAVLYLIANATALGLDSRAVVLLGIIPLVLSVTDPNRSHISGQPAAGDGSGR